MNRKMLGACAAVLLAVGPAAVTGQGGDAAPTKQTRDRLEARMSQLVSAPIRVVERDGLPAGQAAFERLLARARTRHGARSVEVADLLESFGVGLYSLGQSMESRQMREESLPYLQAAIPAYRAAFGEAHPEVAVALNSYADAQLALNEDDPPLSAEAAYEEAFRIRVATLGPTNIETLASLRYLAAVRGLPARTHGDPARIEAAAALFRQLIARSPNDQRLRRESAPYVHIALARMYAQNGMADQAREQLRIAVERTRGWEEEERCFFSEIEVGRVEDILADKAGGRREQSVPGSRSLADCLRSVPA